MWKRKANNKGFQKPLLCFECLQGLFNRGRNRRERHNKTYPKINSSVDAFIIKLADNVFATSTKTVVSDAPIAETIVARLPL